MSLSLSLPSLETPTLAGLRATRRKPSVQLSPEEEESLLKRIGHSAAGGLANISNFLDTGGGGVRAALMGHNPVVAALDPSQRHTGRQMLEHWGVLGRNRPGFDLGDLAGFAAEVATDPLTYLTFGGSALSKAGQALKMAGAMPKLNRVGRMTTKLDSVFAGLDAAKQAKVAESAAKLGTTLDALKNHKIGGLVGIGLPFKEPMAALGTGATAQRIAGKLDRAGEIARFGKLPYTNYSPGIHLASLMSHKAGDGVATRTGQELAEQAFDKAQELRAGSRGEMAGKILNRKDMKVAPSEVRNALEGQLPLDPSEAAKFDPSTRPNTPFNALLAKLPDDARIAAARSFGEPSLRFIEAPYKPRPVIEKIAAQNTPIAKDAAQLAAKLKANQEQLLKYGAAGKSLSNYSHRSLVIPEGVEGITTQSGKVFRTLNRSQAERSLVLRELPTETGRRIGQDKVVQRFVDSLRDYNDPEVRKMFTTYLKQTYGPKTRKSAQALGLLPDFFTNKRGNQQSTYGALRRVLSKMHPETLKQGIFANDAYVDTLKKLEMDDDAIASSDAVLKGLSENLSEVKTKYRHRGIEKGVDVVIPGGQKQFGTPLGTVAKVENGVAEVKLRDPQTRKYIYDPDTDEIVRQQIDVADLQEVPERLRPGRAHYGDTHVPLHKAFKEVGLKHGLENLPDIPSLQSATSMPVSMKGRVPASPFSGAAMIPAETGEGALFEIARRNGWKHVSSDMLHWKVPKDLVNDMAKFKDRFNSPEAVGKLAKAFESYTNLWKAGKLARPARITRDFVSGQLQSLLHGHWSPRSFMQSLSMARGGIPAKLADKGIADLLRARGLPVTDEAATRLLQELEFAHELTGSHAMTTSLVGQNVGQNAVPFEELLHDVPGTSPFTVREVARRFAARDPGMTFNPLDVRGFTSPKTGQTAERTAFGPLAASDMVSNLSDTMNRRVPFISLLKKGYSPEEAAKMVKAMQVDYSTRAMSPVERQVLSKAFPFWRYTRQIIPHTLKTLIEHPGGAHAQTLRAGARMQTDELVPDYMRDMIGARIGTANNGDPRYLSKLGLMGLEDILPFASGGAKGLMTEIAGRAHPLAKFPIEYVTGKSLFQKGPEGPADLERMDPTIGRLLANLTGQDHPLHTPPLLESAVANLAPTSLLTTLRSLTDKRKDIGTKALNTLTGLKVVDIPEQRRDAIIRDQLQKDMKEMGAKAFERLYFDPQSIQEMTPEQRRAAQEFLALNTLLALRAKKRKEQSTAFAQR